VRVIFLANFFLFAQTFPLNLVIEKITVDEYEKRVVGSIKAPSESTEPVSNLLERIILPGENLATLVISHFDSNNFQVKPE